MRAGGLPGHCCPGPCHADLWAGLWWGAGPDCCPPMSLSVGTGGIETAVCALWGPPAQGLGLAPGGPPDTPGLAHTGVGAMTGGQSGVGQRPPASLCPPCPPGLRAPLPSPQANLFPAALVHFGAEQPTGGWGTPCSPDAQGRHLPLGLGGRPTAATCGPLLWVSSWGSHLPRPRPS